MAQKTYSLFTVVIFLCSFCLTIGLTRGTLYATHDPALRWMNPYKTDEGYGCCGINDCIQVQAHALQQGPGWVLVSVNGVEMRLPQGEGNYIGKTHFISDDVDYWCYESDMFEPIGTPGNLFPEGGTKLIQPVFSILPASHGVHGLPEINAENTRCAFISFGG